LRDDGVGGDWWKALILGIYVKRGGHDIPTTTWYSYDVRSAYYMCSRETCCAPFLKGRLLPDVVLIPLLLGGLRTLLLVW
jgi:hypothetical protein